MECRGPDAVGCSGDSDERLLLAHRRLAIIDLSADGNQPMRTEDGELAISFNGEIYNYRTLRRELEARGHRFRSESDTEVLLRLYAEYGPAMLPSLRGMFAFALWDRRRKALLLARDPFGIKPLYYADDGRTIRVASEVKALLAGGGIDTAQQPAGHAGFFLWGHVPEPFTLYRGIRSLPAGCTLSIGESGPEEPRRYRDVSDMLDGPESEPVAVMTAEEVHEHLRVALKDTVRHHLVADVAIGAFLSAGLDSSTLAAIAVEVGGRLRTITLGFAEYRGTPNDETPLAEQVSRALGTDHETIWITRDEFRSELPRLLDRMDQPTIDGVNSYFVSRAAAQAGLKVALSGLGGDELFAGYKSFREIPRLVRTMRRLPVGPAMARGIRAVSSHWLGSLTSPKYAGIFEYGNTVSRAYLLRRALYMPWELARVLDPDLARAGMEELQLDERLEATTRGIEAQHLRISALEASWYMRNQLLRDADWASMTHSLEVRVPLVDAQLWVDAARLIRAGVGLTKKMMARTPSAILPDALIQREKTGFQVPMRDWMLDRNAALAERGLRGWARYVYETAAVGQRLAA